MPAVSVVIPLYNKGPYIARALNSVLAQTFQDFEVIVVDDGSTDNGAAVVERFDDPRIRLIQQENQGVSAARNRGIKEARAELIAFLDADDEWLPRHLETILQLRNKFPGGGAYATRHQIHLLNGKLRSAKICAIPPPPWEGYIPKYFMTVALGDAPACSSTVVIPKKVLLRQGGFAKGERWGEDILLWGKIALEYPIVFSWNVGATCYHDADNRSNSITPPLQEQPFVRHARAIIKSGVVLGDYKDDLKEYITRLEIDRAVWNLIAGDSKNAKQILSPLQTKFFVRRKIFWYILAMIPQTLFHFTLRIKHYLYKGVLKNRYNLAQWIKQQLEESS